MLFRYSSESAILESILRYKKVSIAPCASNSTQCYLWIIKSSIESLIVRQNGEMRKKYLSENHLTVVYTSQDGLVYAVISRTT
ncbi:hypothetical protein ANAPC5_00671 [Anaplasma phagocytophilum]|nr:hypothetical protein ANAPC2_00046 [Anaplasma phagocytophilum]SBO29924.1 hypothetical protein ANAPC4_00038 [Anaplasma phagocytophilum]SBO30175.1 hypothetical protein ANAPC3_00121 [Anaplasma phagocytophilum]SCV63774.1 hypothetical protein ANAPC5_00671 [Anaplasma phagocytophilum]